MSVAAGPGPTPSPSPAPVPAPAPSPAPVLQATLALLEMELRLLARRGENVLATLLVPVALLAFFGLTRPSSDASALLPATIALAIVAAGFVSLGIATAYERSYGVLKRLAGAPVGSIAIVLAKLGSVLVVAAASSALLVATAAAILGWAPGGPVNPAVLVAAVVLGVATFGGLGLALAAVVRAEAALAIANGLFLVFILLGGIVVPVADLPAPILDLARILPSAALTEGIAAGLGSGGSASAVVPLLAWSMAGLVLAAITFRAE